MVHDSLTLHIIDFDDKSLFSIKIFHLNCLLKVLNTENKFGKISKMKIS